MDLSSSNLDKQNSDRCYYVETFKTPFINLLTKMWAIYVTALFYIVSKAHHKTQILKILLPNLKRKSNNHSNKEVKRKNK
jgi:hypothetical protein